MRGLAVAGWSAAVLAILTVGAAAAPKAKAPGAGKAPAASSAPSADHRFAAAAAVWADVQVQVKDLEQLVASKRLDEIHPVAFEIRDLVRTLPDKSPALAPSAAKRLAAQSRVIDRLAEMLDKYGDAGDAAGTQRQRQALLAALAQVKALYPAGALNPPAGHLAGSDKDKELYLTPGGIYTQADIQANGGQLPAQRFKGVKVNHDIKPAVGDRICPITLTKSNPGYRWTVGGKEYTFCCPPCLEEFLRKAKTDPTGIKDPGEYVKK